MSMQDDVISEFGAGDNGITLLGIFTGYRYWGAFPECCYECMLGNNENAQ